MAASLNKATLIGNLGKDPEVRAFQGGGRVAKRQFADWMRDESLPARRR